MVVEDRLHDSLAPIVNALQNSSKLLPLPKGIEADARHLDSSSLGRFNFGSRIKVVPMWAERNKVEPKCEF